MTPIRVEIHCPEEKQAHMDKVNFYKERGVELKYVANKFHEWHGKQVDLIGIFNPENPYAAIRFDHMGIAEYELISPKMLRKI